MLDYLSMVLEGFVVFLQLILVILFGLLTIVTIPIWVIPYLICKAYVELNRK